MTTGFACLTSTVFVLHCLQHIAQDEMAAAQCEATAYAYNTAEHTAQTKL